MTIDSLPKMIEVRQNFAPSQPLNMRAVIEQQFDAVGLSRKITPGMRIAVGVGSRGISNLKEIVRLVLDELIRAGAKPFIVPAMGSHGGATPEGQARMLAGYGITPEIMGVPFETSMEVRKIGTTRSGLEVVYSAVALDADAVLPINRIKPHTDFNGPLGSGIQKMLAVGFGKHAGAANMHRAASRLGHETVIREFAEVVFEKVKILGALAILENQCHQTADIQVMTAEKIVTEEAQLIERAAAMMPRLPMDEIDLLIVDKIGKELSGTGMDTNVIGRGILGYSAGLKADQSASPRIFRIFVRDLSEKTNGNGIGIGLADFTTARLVRDLDMKATYINALTSLGLPTVKIPIYFDTDRETIHHAVASLAYDRPERMRIMRISDTLNLNRLLVSEPCLASMRSDPGVSIAGEPQFMQFDSEGNLLPF